MAIETKNPRLVALLALVSGLVLFVGLLLKPSETVTETAPPRPPSQTEVSRLRQLALRGSIDSMTGFFATVAEELQRHVVHVANHSSSGVVWEEGLVVAPDQGVPFPSWEAIVTASGELMAARTTASGPHLPLAALRALNPEGLPPAPRAYEPPATGTSWLIAIWRDHQRHLTAPTNHLGVREADCGEFVAREVLTGLAVTEVMAGGALFDLDGGLHGVILPCGTRWTPMTVGTVEGLLRDAGSFDGQLLARWGARFAALAPAQSEHFGVEAGALVSELWSGYPAHLAGLQVGDVIIEIDDEVVHTPEELGQLLDSSSGEPVQLRLRRGRSSRQLSLQRPGPPSPGPESEPDPAAGLLWQPPVEGHRVEAVLPGSLADQLGIRLGDRLVRVNHGEPGRLTQVQRTISRRSQRPVVLEFERGQKRWLAFLQ